MYMEITQHQGRDRVGERYSEPGATVIERGHTLGLEVNCRKEEQWLVNSEDRRFKAMYLKERQGRRD